MKISEHKVRTVNDLPGGAIFKLDNSSQIFLKTLDSDYSETVCVDVRTGQVFNVFNDSEVDILYGDMHLYMT